MTLVKHSESRVVRTTRGRSLRKVCPRSGHGAWIPPPTRKNPVEVLEEQAKTRLAELVPVRYGRMAQSPFAFFRGGAAIMAMDLATTPTTGLRVQACGDAHVANFGQFATPERNVVFDINDFDETLPGPWEWDIKRLCASLSVVARQVGFSPSESNSVVAVAAREYRLRMRAYAKMRTLDLWYERIHIEDVVSHFPPTYRHDIERQAKKAARKTHLRAAAKLSRNSSGNECFTEDPPLLVRLSSTEFEMTEVREAIENYRLTLSDDRRFLFDRFELVDVARKVVGVGSVGTHCWVVLFEGPDHPQGDPMVLQVKEALPSVLESYVGPSLLAHHGKRVVAGQRLTQASSDIFLGWTEGPRTQRQYYVRQLWDIKGQGDPTIMDPVGLTYYGALCAWALARAHARTGDPVQIGGYLGTSDAFDCAMATFSSAYARTNEQDYRALLEAINKGRITAR